MIAETGPERDPSKAKGTMPDRRKNDYLFRLPLSCKIKTLFFSKNQLSLQPQKYKTKKTT
jgi:hypothetical protein